MVGTPDAWERAAAPVMAVMIFIILSPHIKKRWMDRMRERLQRETNDESRLEPEK
jgi:hypothetical protein